MTKLMRKFTVVAMVLLIVGSVGLWAQTNTAAADAVIKALPADMQSLYGNLGIPVATAAYDSYKPPKGPWKIGYADSYQGNPWRVSVKDELFRLADSFKKLGKVASIESKVSNNDPRPGSSPSTSASATSPSTKASWSSVNRLSWAEN